MTPDWITEYAQDCRNLLGIGDDWHITITMTDKPDGEEKVGGSVSVDAQYLNAHVELNNKFFVEEDDEAHQIILHEMLHVALGSYRMVVEQAFTQLPDSFRDTADTMISQAEEQFIQRTSRAILTMLKPTGEL